MDKRKELVFNYMQTPRPMGVYAFKNNKNGKMLIGGTPNLDAVQNKIIFQLNAGTTYNKELQQDWNTYGAEAFSFEILEQIKPVEDIKHNYSKEIEELERHYLEKLQPYGDKGYNKPPRK